MASFFEWNFEPERVAAGDTLIAYVTWRVFSAMISMLAGGLAVYAVARPIEPSEMMGAALVPLVFSFGSTSPARFLGRLLFLVIPLGLMFGAYLRISRNRHRISRRADGETD